MNKNPREVEPSESKERCTECGFKKNTCICDWYEKERVDNSIEIIVIQDKREKTNNYNTVCLLQRYFKEIEIVQEDRKKEISKELLDNN